MVPRDEEKERNAKLKAALGGLAIAGSVHPHPAVRTVAWGLDAMLGTNEFHSAWDNGDNFPNQPDDFGNYYGADGMKREAEADRKVDEMTNRIINARWY